MEIAGKYPLARVPELVQSLIDTLTNSYWGKLREAVVSSEEMKSTIPGFLVQPHEIVFYLGSSHLAIEYVGNEHYQRLPPEGASTHIRFFDYSETENNFIDKIVGIAYLGSGKLALCDVWKDVILATNDAVDELERQGWNWDAESYIAPFNTSGLLPAPGYFARIINGRFFGMNGFGLQTRHVKWIDFLPIELTQVDQETESMRVKLGELLAHLPTDATVPYPTSEDDYRYKHLPRVNHFIELISRRDIKETDITRFLDSQDYTFILKMRFCGKTIRAEVECQWQSQQRPSLRLDFVIEDTSGFSQIVEFKLPFLEGAAIVGNENRQHFSAKIAEHIAQTRVYAEYFEDPNNRQWFEAKYKMKVHHPRRILVVGRRWDFDPDVWKSICAENPTVQIMSYDEITDGVVMQFYQ